MSDASTTDPHRSAPRDSMFLAGKLTAAESRRSCDIRVRNLSAEGLMADCALPLKEGEEVMVDIKNIGEVPGSVAWCRGGRIGLHLRFPVDPKMARQRVEGEKMLMPDYLRSQKVLKPALGAKY